MPAARYDFCIEKGDTFEDEFDLVNSDDDGNPTTPVDLTNCSAKLQIRTSAGMPDPPYFEFSTQNGRIVITALAGTIAWSASADSTGALELDDPRGFPAKQSFVYTLELYYPSGRVERLLYGVVSIIEQVTMSQGITP